MRKKLSYKKEMSEMKIIEVIKKRNNFTSMINYSINLCKRLL